MQPNKEQTNTEMAQVEKIIGVILQIGVLISAIIIGIGLLLLLFTGHSGYSGQNFPTYFGAIFHGLIQFKPFAIIMLGIFCLILTPVLRVVVSIYAFAKENDRLYVAITSTVLIILVFAMILGYLDI
ncbi:DUF1634 domain-containing protein [Loigolactobacillus coryniformis]|jgi:uncharacterized membrane protein|uniref:Uncharacterized protein n=1 Tax=Loigolactobacillus coryniformis subsp. torquens DSM 20004 = KCTC 3535 TaxID=1423822 RepID=A0A2D1KKR6_9LACO|nr:DUF1634 domain-containing protein [Loigolactobacillus coryniformis]ATO42708.1 hypothetical protein LC20004_01680 [Loigolactobacillus coryniformis subsp. torquens DSM 20004 = KCTC 3535]KRK74429.1 hypothetical protein FC16_GL000570 [Loigolactobacillus coryniformis subsp. torquens DSM 20004 = KCTC 3535]MCL5457185.1 DUF1634 domain-containing protein [Loigolactobacillus coryniformis]